MGDVLNILILLAIAFVVNLVLTLVGQRQAAVSASDLSKEGRARLVPSSRASRKSPRASAAAKTSTWPRLMRSARRRKRKSVSRQSASASLRPS